MKKVIALMFLFILVFSLTACQKENTEIIENFDDRGSEDETLVEKLTREIDGEYREKGKLPEYSTTIGMVELADEYREKWEDVANEYFDKIAKNEDLNSALSDMKRAWEEYSQAQCENYREILETIYKSGSISGPLFAVYKYEMQKEWALDLVGIYMQFIRE